MHHIVLYQFLRRLDSHPAIFKYGLSLIQWEKMKMTTENIHFFNTMSRTKEKFVPIEKGFVKMYTCGPTVYDFSHIGNMRAFIFEDLFKRWLEYKGFKVTHVMNLTDVDDRTIKAARTQGIPIQQHTEQFTQAFLKDIKTLNI